MLQPTAGWREAAKSDATFKLSRVSCSGRVSFRDRVSTGARSIAQNTLPGILGLDLVPLPSTRYGILAQFCTAKKKYRPIAPRASNEVDLQFLLGAFLPDLALEWPTPPTRSWSWSPRPAGRDRRRAWMEALSRMARAIGEFAMSRRGLVHRRKHRRH